MDRDILTRREKPSKQNLLEVPALSPRFNPGSACSLGTIPTRGGSMDILQQLKAARDKTAFELGRLEAAVSALSGSKSIKPSGKRRTMSASARRKISRAQKARWAKQNSTGRARPRPKISVAGRRRIAAAQRARWAKVNQEKKAA